MVFGRNVPLRSTSVTIQGGNLHVYLPIHKYIKNGDVVRFVICQSFDTANALGTVFLHTANAGDTGVQMRTVYGNDARIDQMRSRRVYEVGFGAQFPVFTALRVLPETAYQYNAYPPQTPAPANENEQTPASAPVSSGRTKNTDGGKTA